MGFEIAWGEVRKKWAVVDNADRSTYETLYGGQLVYAGSDGVLNLGSASGAADTTNKKVPYGVVIGTNRKNPLYNSTYKAEYIQAEDPHSTTTEYVLHQGVWCRNDGTAMVEIALIGPDTYLKGRIFNAAYGTAPTVVTVTTASTTGAGYTAGACDFTPVADLATTYCRSGANIGAYRITTDASTTVRTVGHYFKSDIAVGDTFVSVPIRTEGSSYVQTDSEATYLNCASSPATDYWIVEVAVLDLSVAGDEYCVFRFGADHFAKARA